MNSLNNSVDQVKKKLEASAHDMDTVYERVFSMLENQKRLESHEKALEEMLKYMALLCEKAKNEGITRNDAMQNCLKCNSSRGGDVEQDELMREIKPPEIVDNGSDYAASDCTENTVDYSKRDVEFNCDREAKSAIKSYFGRKMFEKLKEISSTQRSYKFLIIFVLTALVLITTSLHLTNHKKSIAPLYYTILARLASIFSNVWAVIFFY